MKYTIKNFRNEGNNKYVGFYVEYDNNTFAIDKVIALVDGKTDEQYISEAYVMAQPEIDEWIVSLSSIVEKPVEEEEVVEQYLDKEWNPNDNSFVTETV